MLEIAVLGCGRIGSMHARNIQSRPNARIACVHDIMPDSASRLAEELGAHAAASADEAIRSESVDAVLIATATDTHADFIERAVEAGKPVLCEKPIDLDLDRVKACRERVSGSGVPIQIGFNRRFDPGHRAAKTALDEGEIGDLHQVIITSRDPEMPPRSYCESAGGLLRDMTIHDFDLARHFLGAEPVEVFASAEGKVDPGMMAELGDHDMAMVFMKTEDGRQCHINNHRKAVYGYDQRVELMGSKGMLQSNNRKIHEMQRFGAEATGVSQPFQFFFIERYAESYIAELDSFIRSAESGGEPEVGFDDGYRALLLADAAYRSMRERRAVEVAPGP